MLGMKEVREQLDTVNDARPRPREAGIRVDSIDSALPNRGKIEPTSFSEELRYLQRAAIESVSAWHHDEHLGSPCNDVLPRDAHGVRPSPSERIHAAGQFDHLGNPMAAALDRIHPLHAEDPWPGGNRSGSRGDCVATGSTGGDQLFRAGRGAGGTTNLAQVRFDVLEGVRGEEEELGPLCQSPNGGDELIPRRRTDLT
jgi:hypothetical protein